MPYHGQGRFYRIKGQGTLSRMAAEEARSTLPSVTQVAAVLDGLSKRMEAVDLNGSIAKIQRIISRLPRTLQSNITQQLEKAMAGLAALDEVHTDFERALLEIQMAATPPPGKSYTPYLRAAHRLRTKQVRPLIERVRQAFDKDAEIKRIILLLKNTVKEIDKLDKKIRPWFAEMVALSAKLPSNRERQRVVENYGTWNTIMNEMIQGLSEEAAEFEKVYTNIIAERERKQKQRGKLGAPRRV